MKFASKFFKPDCITHPNYCSDDPLMIRFLSTQLKKRDTVFDVGAMNGAISIFCATKIGKYGMVHSFEPEEKNQEEIIKNIHSYKISNIILNKCAVSDKSEYRILNIFIKPGWHSFGIPIINNMRLKPLKQKIVKTVSIDEYCMKHKIYEINLLKIDTEGFEHKVLKGSNKMLKCKAINCIIFEISRSTMLGTGEKPDKIFYYLKNTGYNIYSFYSRTKKRELIQLDSPSLIDVAFGNFAAFPK